MIDHSVKSVPYKHEDLSSVLRTHIMDLWLTIEGRLTGQKAPRIYLSLPPQCLDYKHMSIRDSTWEQNCGQHLSINTRDFSLASIYMCICMPASLPPTHTAWTVGNRLFFFFINYIAPFLNEKWVSSIFWSPDWVGVYLPRGSSLV